MIKHGFALIMIISVTIIGTLSFVSTFATSTYYSEEFGFSIDYPEEWSFDDEPFSIENYISVITFYDNIDAWNSMFDVSYIIGGEGANLEDEYYIDYLLNIEQDICEFTSFDTETYICSDFVLLDSKKLFINGRSAYQIMYTWTETYPDDSFYENVSIITEIPVGEDVWSLYSETVIEDFPEFTDDIESMIKSFTSEFEPAPALFTVVPTQMPDPDGDHFLGPDDRCPYSPEIINGYKDHDGCPDNAPDTDGDSSMTDQWIGIAAVIAAIGSVIGGIAAFRRKR